MGMMIFRPGQRIVIPGVQVFAPRVTSAAATWWDNNGAISGCVAAYAPKGAVDLASSYINLANPGTYNAAPGVAPTFSSADGWTGNGTSQYLTTGITPAFGWSAIVRFSSVTNAGSLFGTVGTGTKRWNIYPNNTGVVFGYDGNYVRSPVLAAGVLAMTQERGYRNGSADGANFSAPSGSVGRALLILARDNNGSIDSICAAKIQALAIYNVTLTAGEVATITTAMQAL